AVAAVWFLAPDLISDTLLPLLPKSANAKNQVVSKQELDGLKTQVNNLSREKTALEEKVPELQKAADKVPELESQLEERKKSEDKLTQALAGLHEAKKKGDSLFQNVLAALANAKYIPDADPAKFNLPALQKAIKDFSDSKGNLAVVETKLKNAQTALQDVQGKLSAVDDTQAKARVEKGAKGIEELIAARS